MALNLENLPYHLLWQTAVETPAGDLLKLCQESRRLREICHDDNLWAHRLHLDYPLYFSLRTPDWPITYRQQYEDLFFLSTMTARDRTILLTAFRPDDLALTRSSLSLVFPVRPLTLIEKDTERFLLPDFTLLRLSYPEEILSVIIRNISQGEGFLPEPSFDLTWKYLAEIDSVTRDRSSLLGVNDLEEDLSYLGHLRRRQNKQAAAYAFPTEKEAKEFLELAQEKGYLVCRSEADELVNLSKPLSAEYDKGDTFGPLFQLERSKKNISRSSPLGDVVVTKVTTNNGISSTVAILANLEMSTIDELSNRALINLYERLVENGKLGRKDIPPFMKKVLGIPSADSEVANVQRRISKINSEYSDVLHLRKQYNRIREVASAYGGRRKLKNFVLRPLHQYLTSLSKRDFSEEEIQERWLKFSFTEEGRGSFLSILQVMQMVGAMADYFGSSFGSDEPDCEKWFIKVNLGDLRVGNIFLFDNLKKEMKLYGEKGVMFQHIVKYIEPMLLQELYPEYRSLIPNINTSVQEPLARLGRERKAAYLLVRPLECQREILLTYYRFKIVPKEAGSKIEYPCSRIVTDWGGNPWLYKSLKK